MLDFKELSVNGNDFELLMRELLFNMGMQVYWSGKGPDGGKDLLCIETIKGHLSEVVKRWLVQCKHTAHAAKAVSNNNLAGIVEACNQHDATGYLLVCSTYPSSATIELLKGVEESKHNHITSAKYWDNVTIERLLSTPKNWPIAQRFFPLSANKQRWQVYATENPNHWIVNYRGYYFHLSNRIGSYGEMHFSNIEKRIKEFEKLPFPQKHWLRPRALYYDDKNGNYTFYLDYLIPYNEKPFMNHSTIKRLLHDGEVIDGQFYKFDIYIYTYMDSSDHFDLDHYDYYRPFVGTFVTGFNRVDQRYITLVNQDVIWLSDDKNTPWITDSFNRLEVAFSKLEFIQVIRTINCKIEYLDCLAEREDWSYAMSDMSHEVDQFFSARFIFNVSNKVKLDKLIRYIPLSFEKRVELYKRLIYLPDMEEHQVPNEVYELVIIIDPMIVRNKEEVRLKINEWFDEISGLIENFNDRKDFMG